MPSLTERQLRERTIRLKARYPDTDGQPKVYCVHLGGQSSTFSPSPSRS